METSMDDRQQELLDRLLEWEALPHGAESPMPGFRTRDVGAIAGKFLQWFRYQCFGAEIRTARRWTPEMREYVERELLIAGGFEATVRMESGQLVAVERELCFVVGEYARVNMTRYRRLRRHVFRIPRSSS